MNRTMIRIFSILLVFSILLPLAAQRYRGKNPFLRELSAVREYREKVQKAKKPRAKARLTARLKQAEKELADALKEELAELDAFIKKEEEKMKPYKENIKKLEAEKKRLQALAAGKDPNAVQEKAKDAKDAKKNGKKAASAVDEDDGVMEETSGNSSSSGRKKSFLERMQEKKLRKR